MEWDFIGLTTQKYLANPEDTAFSAVANEVHIYTEATTPDDIFNVSEVWGYGARFSASGYLDATYWTVLDTRQKAAQHLLDMFGFSGLADRDDWEVELEIIANTKD